MNKWIFEATKSFIPKAEKFYGDRFDREGWQPNTFKKWKPLAKSTLKIRKSEGYPYPQYPMLNKTGRLKRSIKYKASNRGLSIFTTLKYAWYNNRTRPFIYRSGLLTIQYNKHLNDYIADKLNNMKF